MHLRPTTTASNQACLQLCVMALMTAAVCPWAKVCSQTSVKSCQPFPNPLLILASDRACSSWSVRPLGLQKRLLRQSHRCH